MLRLFVLFCRLGSSTSCFTASDLASLGISPAKRHCGPFTTGFVNWESGRFSTAVQTILLRDAMGYSFNAPIVFNGPPFDKFEDQTLDFMPEIWQNQNKDKIKEMTIDSDILANYGEGGYSGTAGWYIPDYSAAETPAGDLAYYDFKTNVSMVSKFSTNFTEFILNDTNLLSSMGQSVPNDYFTPPICDTQTCMDVIAMSSSWDPNFFQAQIINLGLPWRITYWGWGGEHKLVKSLYEAGRHVVFYIYTPDTLPFKAPAVRVMFPAVSDACIDGHNTNNTQGLYSTVNCAYPRTPLIKMARKAALNSVCAEDIKLFLGQFIVPSKHLDNLIAGTLVTPVEYTLDNSAFEATACTWLKAHPEIWLGWIRNNGIHDSLSAEEIVMYCVASIMGVLFLVFLMWKLGVLDGLEAVLFDMTIMYIGKIFNDLFDLFTDIMCFFKAVQGNVDIPMWFKVLFLLIISASAIASAGAVYFNAKSAMEAFKTRARVAAEDVNEQEIQKIRDRSSLWQGSHARPRASDIHKGKDLERIWTQEELDFAIKRIGECYIDLAVAVTEDIPMMGIYITLMLRYPDVITMFFYFSMLWSSFSLGMRLNQFYKIIVYRKQHEYASKAYEIHERQVEIQQGIQGLAKKECWKPN